VIEKNHHSYGIVGINILGDSHFSYITNNAITIVYNDTIVDMENHSLTIDHYHINSVIEDSFECKMDLHLDQKNYRVKVYLKESIFQYLESRIAFCAVFTSEGIGGNAVMIINIANLPETMAAQLGYIC